MRTKESNKGIDHFTIVKILKKFTSKELNEFEKLLCSPFFNNHSTIIKLFSELKKYYPSFSDKKITKEYLFDVVNKGKKYDDKIFRKYLSRINKLAEEYLSILQLRSEDHMKELNVLKQLSKRDIDEVFLKKLNGVEKNFEKNKIIDHDMFYLKHVLSSVKFNHLTAGNYGDLHNETLLNIFKNLYNYFISYTSSTLGQIETYKYSYASNYENDLLLKLLDNSKIQEQMEEMRKTIDANDNDQRLFLELILNDLKMISHENGLSSYYDLKTLVISNSNKLSREMLLYYFQRLNVFCIIENTNGKNDFQKELFENYKLMINNDLFNINGSKSLELVDFRSIVTSSLKNNEFDWCEKFLMENIGIVKEVSRNNLFNYGSALLCFYKNNFSGSLEHLSGIKTGSLPIIIDIYILRAKIFYMLGHFDSALSLADSFRHFVSGNKLIAEGHKENLMNFLKYFRLIIRSNLNGNRKKLNSVLTKLQMASNTREKKWMIDVISEIRPKRS